MRSPVEALRRRASLRTKRRIATARLRVRALTASRRVLPGALVLGAQRAGTSSLYRYLGAHPQVAPSVRKETEYFTRRRAEGEDWYRSHFTLRHDRLAFEATPDYLFVPGVEQRVAALLPHARLVVLLREPGERALSHHRHMVRLGYEDLPLRAALAAEAERLGADLESLAAGGEVADLRPLLRFSYRARGAYGAQLERWLTVVPREQLLVVRSEDLFADPLSTLHRVEAFLGLEAWAPAQFENHSLRGGPAEELDPDDAAALEDLRSGLAADGAHLRDLVGDQIRWS